MHNKRFYAPALLLLAVFLPHLQGHAQKPGDFAITIHQETDFRATPHQLYAALTGSEAFSACTKKSFPSFSATSATIDAVPGGSFSVFDGHIVGRIVELVPDERIVEAWRVVDWPVGIYSIVRFEFHQSQTGTTIVFDHTGFPEGLKEHLASGWQEHYWAALAKYLQQ